MRAAPSKVGWMPSLLIRPGFLQKDCQLSVAHVVCWTPSRQPAIEGGHATKHVITGQIWQGSRENSHLAFTSSVSTDVSIRILPYIHGIVFLGSILFSAISVQYCSK